MLKINIGGRKGFNHYTQEIQKQWKIMDITSDADYRYNLNSLKLMPLKDNTVDYYYASMILEHVEPEILPFVFKEIFRTLKPAGCIRIVVPDILIGIQDYISKKIPKIKGPYQDRRYPPTPLCKLLSWINSKGKKGRLEHRMAFDWDTLIYFLEQADFTRIEKRSFNICSSVFQGKDILKYKNWSIYLEAQKLNT